MPFDVVPWGHEIYDAYPDYPQALAVGGRGRGASVLFAQVVVKAMLEYGHDALVGREHQTSIKQSNINLIKRVIRNSEYAGYFNLGLRNEIRCVQTGAVCEFKGIRRSLEDWRSLDGYACVWLEEPHMMTADQLDVVMPSLREPGQVLLASWNPYLPNSPIERLRGFDDGIVEFRTYEDNPYFPDELERVREYDLKAQTSERYGWIWKGLFLPQDESALFPYEIILRAFEARDDEEQVEDSQAELVAGIDIAGSKRGDYTAMVILDPSGREVFSDRVRQPNLKERINWIYKRLAANGCELAYVDCTGGRGEAEVDALLDKYDMAAHPVIFTNKSKTVMLDSLHSALAYDELRLVNPDIRDELIDLGEDGKALKGYDDYAMALAMAVANQSVELRTMEFDL